MDNSITEKTFPIENRWVTKNIVLTSFSTIFIAIMFSIQPYLSYKYDQSGVSILWVIIFPVIIILAGIVRIIGFSLQRSNFFYSLEEHNFMCKQGIISKKETHIPYGTIQNIYLKQDIVDRLIGLSNISIENASVGGGYVADQQIQNNKYYGEPLFLGVSGNKLSIYGLTTENAEKLKKLIMKKMMENPIDDSYSGL